jgi:hypothetical protein
MTEPLTIDFHRSAGIGKPELSGRFTDFTLDPDDTRVWLDTERPYVATRREPRDGCVYELTFRRGGERRRVVLHDDDLDARTLPLVQRLVSLCDHG